MACFYATELLWSVIRWNCAKKRYQLKACLSLSLSRALILFSQTPDNTGWTKNQVGQTTHSQLAVTCTVPDWTVPDMILRRIHTTSLIFIICGCKNMLLQYVHNLQLIDNSVFVKYLMLLRLHTDKGKSDIMRGPGRTSQWIVQLLFKVRMFYTTRRTDFGLSSMHCKLSPVRNLPHCKF